MTFHTISEKLAKEEKMKYIIPIVILSLVLLSCKKDEEETSTTTELEGTWKSACYTNSDNTSAIVTPTFAGNVLTITGEKHSDTSCATDYRLREESHTFSMGDAGKFSLTIGTIKRTPQSSTAVTAYNSASKCSANDWELNTAKDCTEADGDQGDTYYCFYQLSGNTLYVNCDSSTYPTSVDTSKASDTFTKQ